MANNAGLLRQWTRDVGEKQALSRPPGLFTIGKPLLPPLLYVAKDTPTTSLPSDSNRNAAASAPQPKITLPDQDKPRFKALLRPNDKNQVLLKTTHEADGYAFAGEPLLHRETADGQLPRVFDWREKTGFDGQPLLLPVKDQGGCGSCWSQCTVQMLAHRFSIVTHGHQRVALSAQDLINCGRTFIRDTFHNPQYNTTLQDLYRRKILVEANWYALQGCDGGLLVSALDFLTIYGVLPESEEPYRAREGTCKRVEEREKMKRYFGRKVHALTFGREDGLPEEDVRIDPGTLAKNIENMQRALVTDGPIVASLNLYSDFLYYPKLGEVYARDRSTITVDGRQERVEFSGAHAVLVVGYGETTANPPVKYWICENCWGTDWGKQGYFYIKRGQNLCNIEYDCYGIFPNLTDDPVAAMPANIADPVSNSDNSSSGWWIAAIVIVALVVLAVVISLAVVLSGKKK